MAFRPPPVYPLTHRPVPCGLSHAQQVEVLAAAGHRLCQVRDKGQDDADLLLDLRAAVEAGRRAGTLVLVNDRPDLALLSGAGGVHLGPDDLPLADARRLLGPAAVVGASSRDEGTARQAEEDGADYVAYGPIFATGTPADPRPPVGLEALGRVRAALKVPLVAIGGITLERAPAVLAAGADSVAVIGDLAGSGALERRAREWLDRLPSPVHARRGLIFLTGFMGAGKTTVGRLLAARLGKRFVDLDRALEALEGMTVAALFASRGEAAFRAGEARLLASLPAGGDAVVALGGGALLDPGLGERVRSRGALIWLDCPLDEALRRSSPAGDRPLLRAGETAGALLARRLPGYRRAHLRVDASGPDPEAVAAAIERLLEGSPTRP